MRVPQIGNPPSGFPLAKTPEGVRFAAAVVVGTNHRPKPAFACNLPALQIGNPPSGAAGSLRKKG
jgi:hypothetical protein